MILKNLKFTGISNALQKFLFSTQLDSSRNENLNFLGFSVSWSSSCLGIKGLLLSWLFDNDFTLFEGNKNLSFSSYFFSFSYYVSATIIGIWKAKKSVKNYIVLLISNYFTVKNFSMLFFSCKKIKSDRPRCLRSDWVSFKFLLMLTWKWNFFIQFQKCLKMATLEWELF